MFSRILVQPFKVNPFQKMKVENGLIIDTGGYTPHTQLNEQTGRYEEQKQFIVTGCVVEVGPEVKYLKEGDVISFYSADPALDGAVNTHRVIAIEQDGTEWKYTTQGDANNIPDQYGTDSEALIGKVVASSLALGKLARLVANPLVFIPVILIPLAVILISNLVRTIRLAGKIAKDEEEAAVREAIREIQEKRQKEKENSSDKEQ